ncbi:MAG: hypothetical protein EXS63_03870 [Candidatus Omnitrophica bacterium]|nr:hypothetical protein [Candidatus Omnitrophota bacterium]
MNPKSIEKKDAAPFFLIEKRGKDKRYTAWSGDLDQIKKLYGSLIDQFSEDIEILFKIKKEEKKTWENYYGKNNLSDLKRTIQKREEWFFCDGEVQISVKRIDTGEYLTFDEHGVLYLYADPSKNYAATFKAAGFQEEQEAAVFEEGHWHISPKDSEKYRADFLRELHLEKV